MADDGRILGIDVASQDAGTAACVLAVGMDAIRIERLEVGIGNAQLAELAASCTYVGIDAPFGWPRSFVAAVRSWHDDHRWPQADDPGAEPWRRPYALRTTDRAVWERTGHRPISVSTDRIAYAAMRTAHLLTVLDTVPGTDGSWHTPHGARVSEVYPAGTLRALGIDARGYRTSPEVRADVAQRVAATWEAVHIPDPLDALVAVDHAFDAWLAALTAWRASLGATVLPTHDERDDASFEGWIHLPDEVMDGSRRPGRD